MKRKTLVLLAGVLLLVIGMIAGIGLSRSSKIVQSEEQSISKQPITIVCYGDSNTWGFHPETWGRYPHEERWTTLLQEKLGSDYLVIPEGLNSRTTAFDPAGDEAWKNGLYAISPVIGTHKPIDILLFMLGTNDCKFTQNVTAEEIAAGMDQLLTQAEKTCKEVQGDTPVMIVVAPPAILPDLEGTSFEKEFDVTSSEKSIELAQYYEEVAKKHNCIFIKATNQAEISPIDGVHLTTNGHAQLAEIIYSEIHNLQVK